jgi:hypothetical protein
LTNEKERLAKELEKVNLDNVEANKLIEERKPELANLQSKIDQLEESSSSSSNLNQQLDERIVIK